MERNLYIDASHPSETRVVLKSEENIEDMSMKAKRIYSLEAISI